MRRPLRALLLVAATAGPLLAQRTRPERTAYRETSSLADVWAFLDTLKARGAPVHLDTLGRSPQGRPLPLVIASRPLVRTVAEARRLRRPVVYLQGNIHGGEIEGKEALQALLRDLSADRAPNALDSLVLVVVPVYNADGNEALGPQERQRGAQQGPERVGQRANGQALDLNRDYVKAEALETRAALALLNRWDPDVFVDLHTTDGSYHGYALTYAPSLHPGADGFTRDTLLPRLRARMDAAGFPAFDYGNFSADERDDPLAFPKQKWVTYDHRLRYGVNYYGLRGGVAILSEAYSHDPLERRVRSTYAFLQAILHEASAPSFRRHPRRVAPGEVVLRASLPPRGERLPVLAEVIERTGDTLRTEAGFPKGLRRTGRMRADTLEVLRRFAPTRTAPRPAGWWLPANADTIVAMLRLHGVRVSRPDGTVRATASTFTIDSVVTAPRAFQGHRETRLEGRWSAPARAPLAPGGFVVRADQPLGTLAMLLLEPETDDGFVTWNFLDRWLGPGRAYPVRRLTGRLPSGDPIP